LLRCVVFCVSCNLYKMSSTAVIVVVAGISVSSIILLKQLPDSLWPINSVRIVGLVTTVCWSHGAIDRRWRQRAIVW